MTKSFTGKAIIGLDLDGVCADYTAGLRSFLAQERGIDPAMLPEPEVYNLGKAGWGFESTRDYLDAHQRAVKAGLYRDLPVIPGVSEAMKKISDAGAHIRVVTHRLIFGSSHSKIVSDTAAWLDDAGIPYMSLCFTGLKDSVGAHCYVDDSPDNIESLERMGFHTFIYNQRYNRDVPGPRIQNWEDGADQIIEYLRSISQLDS